MAQKKALLHLIMIMILGFSYFLSVDATPLSRSLNLADQELATQDFVEYYKTLMEQRLINYGSTSSSTTFEEQREVEGEGEEELFITDHGRMVLQSNDYPGTGANNHHDPKPPGTGANNHHDPKPPAGRN